MNKLSRKLALLLVLSMIFYILPLGIVNAEVQSPITRFEAEERALNIINYKWTFTSALNTKVESMYASSVALPEQFKYLATSNATGIPYNWGGLDSPYTKSDNSTWSNFTDAINKGAYAGNVNTEAGLGYIPGTAGIDCSGFVQAVFNIKDSKQSTGTLTDKYFTKISLDQIKHMDVLIKYYDHAAIFDRWGTLNGVFGAFTYESTTDQDFGGIQGTKRYFMTLDEIKDGFVPLRYNYLNDNIPYPASTKIFSQVSNVNTAANYRTNPYMGSAVIGTILKGTIVYLIDYYSGWYKISYNAKTGWIWGNLISSIPSGKYVTIRNASQLNIRSAPSTTASIVGVLSKNQYAKVMDYSADGKWYKISINGIQGWSSKAYLSYIY